MPARLLVLTVLLGAPLSARSHDLIMLLQARSCPYCKLANADLVHSDLRNANFKGAQLQRANLSQALLDGADLSGSDLSFTSFNGASLRGADLRGSRLIGTDLRGTDLTNALLDPNALKQSHWIGARGVSKGARSHSDLHNAGVEAAKAGRWTQAEKLFNTAIEADPNQPLSWVARGLSRSEQGKTDLASRDFAHAGQLFSDKGETVRAEQLLEASRLVYATPEEQDEINGIGAGSALIGAALSTAQALTAIALEVLMPIVP